MRSGFQAFIAGFIGPALVFILLTLVLVPEGNFHFVRLYPFYLLPLLWGFWDVLYYYFARHIIFLKKLGIWGALLGLMTSLVGIYRYDTWKLLQQHVLAELDLANTILLEVVIYFLLWEIVVRYFNRSLID